MQAPVVSSHVVKDLAVVKEIFTKLNLDSTMFLELYHEALSAMGNTDSHELQESPWLLSHLVGLSPLHWNPVSHSYHCDWGLTAVAFTLEAALMPDYRQAILCDCGYAHMPRSELKNIFISVSHGLWKDVPGEELVHVLKWEFADGLNSLKLGEPCDQVSRYFS